MEANPLQPPKRQLQYVRDLFGFLGNGKYSLAAKSGNKEASELLDHLVKELSPQQLSKAQIQLDEWEPGQCERDLMEEIPQGYTPAIW